MLPVERVAPLTDRTLIRGALVWDGTGAEDVRPLDILIQAGLIAQVAPQGSIQPEPHTQIIDGGGMYAVPGLADMHVHLAPGNATELCVAAGVTCVRDVGNYSEWIFGLRAATQAGRLPGPRIFAAGEIIEGPIPCRRGFTRTTTAEEVRIAVRALIDRGADGIKVYQSVPPAMVTAAVEEAHRLGVWVAGHLCCMNFIHAWYGGESTRRFEGHEQCEGALAAGVAAGIDSLEHAFTVSTRVLEPMLAQGVAFCPTLGCGGGQGGFKDPRLAPDLELLFEDPYEVAGRRPGAEANSRRSELWFESQKDFVREFSRAGGLVLPGTDCPFGVAPGFGLHREFEIMRDCGLSPHKILLSATRHAAETLRAARSQGSIESGKSADIVLLTANPLEDISNIRTVNTVVQAGRIYSPEALRRLRESKQHHSPRPQEAKRNGRAPAYEARGSGPPLALLADGPGGSAIEVGRRSGSADWFSLSELALDHRMLFIDPAGTGASAPAIEGTASTPFEMAKDVKAAREAENLDSLTLVAHGTGALTALAYALSYRNTVDRLILVNPVVSPALMARDMRTLLETADGGLRADLNRAAASGIYDETTGAYRQEYWEAALKLLGASHQPFRLMLGFRFDSLPGRFQWKTYRRLWKPRGEFDIAGEWAGLNLSDELDSISAPVLVITGAFDRPAQGQARLLAERLSDVQLVTFTESGHYPFVEEVDRFMRVVRAFVSDRDRVAEAWLGALPVGPEIAPVPTQMRTLLAAALGNAQTFKLVDDAAGARARFVFSPELVTGEDGNGSIRIEASDSGATPAQAIIEEPLTSNGDAAGAVKRAAGRLRAWAGDSFEAVVSALQAG